MSDRFWLPTFTAFVIWARFSNDQTWGVSTFGGLIIIGIAAENLLNTFWKDKALAASNRFKVRFWQAPKPPASLSRKSRTPAHSTSPVAAVPGPETGLKEPGVSYLPKSYGPKTREE